MSKVRWFFIALFFLVSIVSSFDLGTFINNIMSILSVLSLFIAAILHGKARLGLKFRNLFCNYLDCESLF
jgi:hypothetical protein